MPASRKYLAAAFVLVLTLSAVVSVASGKKKDAFIEISTGDFTSFCAWEESCFSPTGEVYYNRVDGLLVYLGAQYRSDLMLHPRVHAMVGWPSSRDDRYYKVGVEQPVFSQDGLSFGVDLYEKTAWSREDDDAISDFGNNMAAFFARFDERDYFKRDGYTAFAQHKVTPELTLRLEFRNDRLASLEEHDDVWTVLHSKDDWRDNPPLEVGIPGNSREFVGRMKSYVLSVVYDDRDEERSGGWLARGFFELTTEATGGDYDFKKYVVDATKQFAVTSTQTLTLKGVLGKGSGTEFPSHKLFHLGGRRDLMGYGLKEFGGKDLVFGRVEYTVGISENVDFIYTGNVGSVEYGTSSKSTNETDGFKSDMAIGFRTEAPWDGHIRLDFARALEDDAEVQTYLSLTLSP